MSLVELIDAMESAGTTDVRGLSVLPFALKALRKGAMSRDPEVRAPLATMRAWVKNGAHRIDRDNDGNYDQADAVRIMDAWWPLWVRGQFEPTLGENLRPDVHRRGQPDPRRAGRGRLGLPERRLRLRPEGPSLGAQPEGQGSLLAGVLRQGQARRGAGGCCASTLKQAAAVPGGEQLYGSEGCEAQQRLPRRVRRCATTPSTRPTSRRRRSREFHWINRPTFRQAIEYRDGR